MFEEKKFKASEVEINYAVGPDNGSPLLLLHGLTSHWRANLLLAPFLIQKWQVFAPDFRGHGKSGRVAESYTIPNYAKDIIEFIKQEIKQPVIIFGHSLGGFVAGLIASEIPELVKGIIIGDATFDNERAIKWLEPAILVADFWINTLAKKPSELDILGILLQTPMKLPDKDKKVPNIDFPGVDVAGLFFTAKSYSCLDPDVFKSIKEVRKVIEKYNAEEFLPKITCPVLLLRADPKLNSLMSDGDIELAKKHVKNLSYIKYKGINHSLFFHEFNPIVKAIVAFSIFLS